MDHIPVNATNFFVIGLSSAIFIGGGTFVLIWLSSLHLPVVSTVAQVIIGAIHKL